MDGSGHAQSGWERDYDLDDPTKEDARARAKAKLDAIRSGRVVLQPAGRYWGRVFGGFLTAVIAAGFLYGAYLAASEGDDTAIYVAWFVGIIGALLFIPVYRLLYGSRATTPFRALNLYYRLLGGGKHKGARKLVVPNDFDHFPRAFPHIGKVKGFPGAEWLFFNQPADYKDYWESMLRWPTSPYCIARVHALNVEELAPDVVRCDFTLKLGIGTSLWILLIFFGPGIILAFILDAATRTNITARMSKVLVKVDDEWQLFNGAWHEADEQSTSWI